MSPHWHLSSSLFPEVKCCVLPFYGFSCCGFSFLWMVGHFKFWLRAAPAPISTWREEPARLFHFIFFISAVTECWFQPAQECDTPNSHPFFGTDSKSHSNKSYRWLYLETPRLICARAEASIVYCTATKAQQLLSCKPMRILFSILTLANKKLAEINSPLVFFIIMHTIIKLLEACCKILNKYGFQHSAQFSLRVPSMTEWDQAQVCGKQVLLSKLFETKRTC